MADIGPITAKVVATSAGMAGGLSEAEKKLKASTSKMADQAKKDGAAAGKGFASALTQGLSIAGGMKLFDLGASAVRGVADLLTGGAARMAEVGKAARQAGADVAGFQAIVEALDNDLGTATEGIVKLKEAMGKALVEGQTGVFDRLGINALDLVGMREDKAFVTIAERLRELGGGVAEARAGVALFGDKFKDLRHVLDDGGEHIRKTAEDLQKFGAAFGEADFLQSREWSRALNQFTLMWKGLQNQIAQGLMPVINEFFERVGSLADLGLTFKGLSATIINTVDVLGKGVLFLKEAWADTSLIRKGWDVLFEHIKAGFFSLLATMQRANAEAWEGSWLGDIMSVSGRANAELNEARAKGATLEAKRLGMLLKQELGGKDSFKWWDEFMTAARKRNEAIGGGLAKVGQDLFRLWDEGAERMSKALEGPIDKFRESLKQVKALSALKEAWLVGPMPEGGGGITDAQALTLAGAFQQLKGAFGGAAGYNPAAAMLADSREAYSAIQAFRQSSTRESVEEALKRILQQQLDQERDQVDLGRRVAVATEKLAKTLVPRGID